ncbi:MAG: N-6 DNA methylase [Anaerostipes sp.]|nr:N-6 DNA methylase [Anaerostipes sp.]
MGRNGEQHPAVSGGDREDGIDQPLAWYDRSKEDKSLPFFHRDQDIKELLLTTPYLKAKKAEIRAFFEREEDRETRRDYIKNIFNHEPTELTLQDGRTVGYKTYQNVLHLWEGSVSSRIAQSYYDWSVIADYFEGMRLLGELRDQTEPLRTVDGQLEFLQDLAEEKTSAFSFSQEMVDYVLRSGSGIQHGKFRIYSYFLQGHSRREQEEFLKEEYGMGGRSPILSGTGISEDHSAKGLKLSRGYQEGAPQLILKWSQVAKRIEELIAADRYMTAKELEYLPEYEKHILTREIYHFYSDQPEEVIRPYARGAMYDEAIRQIRPQLEEKKRVEQLAEEMSSVLANTADFDRKYAAMRKAYRDVCEFRDGIFSLFTPIPAEKGTVPLPISETLSSPEHVEEETEKEEENTEDLAPDQEEVYELQTDTLVYIGVDEYEILSISEDVVRLRNQKYPIFTEEMPREEFERKLRENPANDFLKKRKEPEEISLQEPDLPAEKETAQDLSPAWEKATPRKTDSFDLHPEIPQSQRLQFQITDDALGRGTAREKFRANVKAIQVLKQCEAQNRYATREEQQVLSGYVGWGGLADAFDASVSAWNQEYVELKRILTKEEYRAARESTMTAFYTPPVVIRSIYQALENMGFQSGNILEPSCGIGNFIGMKPEHLSDCNIYGVEIDSISGRIARQLYQKSAIAVQGYEETNLPDSFFDVVVGNVPFANYKVLDKRYDSLNFLIHDYFIAKSIDKTRPGGILALITSNGISGGTMDKRDNRVRKYIAERCDLLGAIRLPNNTFLENAGTVVNTDILFLQKKENPRSTELPAWVDVNVLQRNDFTNEKGETKHRTVCINPYFQEHPEMVLGKLEIVSGAYGPQLVCKPFEDADLGELLSEAIQNISAQITEYEVEELVETEDHSIPAEPDVANFSYALRDGKIYYRENSRMRPVELSLTGENRVKGMIAIRDCVRELIAYQMEEYSDEVIAEQQRKLNRLYDQFQSRYGLLNSRANSLVFSEDNSYPLLCSLEIVAEDGTLERKADMFTKRTIKPHQTVTRVDTASEALSLSLSEHARVDMEYMCTLTGKSAEEIEKELEGVIFRLPDLSGKEPTFVSEDEYLSGNVREKLKEAMFAAESSELYRPNVEALKRVQPKDLSASEINVRLGATWIPPEDIKDFMFELLQTPNYCQWKMNVRFVPVTGEWYIEGKSIDKGNVKANSTYGTHRVNAYRILEDTLNLRDVRVYDYVEDEAGRKKPILNKKETAIAQGKQDLIKQEFLNWIWKEPERRQRLTAYYNEKFNAIRPREYDGSHLNFYGMNPEIQLRQHQKNGVARIIYGGNTLLAYVVGAGKTYTMVAAAMESKRLGLCNKSMIVVPNHIIDQFAAEWLQLYPSANLLVATKKDFETKNRKKFCARIATSEIDAVIIGHSQFERIPLSVERQCRMLQEQIQETVLGIQEAGREKGNRITVKRLEKMKKTLETRLKRLNDQSKKDDVVCFEELGIDRLFVDEADSYKNLYLYTKMRNVGGIAQTEAQKSSDMFMKTRYMDEVTGGRGVIFATGTPISNSMVELYTMQRYLQYNTLVEHNLQFFDAWASTFGETVTAIELAPEGTGYRLKTRFAKFYNLPELMMMFREVADIQTADMLNLPVPEAEYRVISVKPSDMQKEMVTELGERAERVRNGMVNPTEDNMLLITNEGRKLALDQRLVNEMLPDDDNSKVNACVDEVYRFWYDTKEDKLTQLLFCDLSTPKKDGSFSVYNDVRDKLVSKGVPEKEIQFIHDANTEVRKKELFAKVRKGDVRILMGSTFKMGAGTNVQDLIIASHDLDCPWRPRDVGRILRTFKIKKNVEVTDNGKIII